MALIDEIFGPSEALLTDWGRDITYIKTTSTCITTQPPAVTGADTNVTVRGLAASTSAS